MCFTYIHVRVKIYFYKVQNIKQYTRNNIIIIFNMRSTDRSFVVTGNLSFQQCVEYVEYLLIGQNYSTKKRFVGVDMSEMNKYI